MKLNDIVNINENFKKSMNLHLDRSNHGFLETFILSPSNQVNLARIANAAQNGHGAFTFTGPYGSGKSSFALYLAELLDPVNKQSYELCLSKIDDEDFRGNEFFSFHFKREVVAIIGEPVSPIDLLSKKLCCPATAEAILEALQVKIAAGDGLILIVDEMGKLLEGTALNRQHDVYLFQQIAELANSSQGKFIFIGILHQSFIEYAAELNKKIQNEWYKIHGRFLDLVIDTTNEEKLGLIGRTILSNKKLEGGNDLIDVTISTVLKNRPINPESYEELLIACWPLSPVVALLLGPLSLKDFGQNQRSIFSFLNSQEPAGFQNYLETTDYNKQSIYGINEFWDYIKYNFDFLLSRSSDARRWIMAQEVLDKLYAQSSASTFNLQAAAIVLKLISLIEIFKGNTGLVASKPLIQKVVQASQKIKVDKIDELLVKLREFSLIREAYDKSSYVLFDGSDFNIDHALSDALRQVLNIDYMRLNQIASFQPIIAKKHYHETGAIRWMSLSLVPYKSWKGNQNSVEEFGNTKFGAWNILIPADQGEYEEARILIQNRKDFDSERPIVLSVSPDYDLVNQSARELLALEWIEKNTPSLMGDRVARQEIENRKRHLSLRIRDIIAALKGELEWWTKESIGTLNDYAMTRFASDFAKKAFYKSLSLHTELLNNNKPSGNANGAVNALLRKMVLHEQLENLAFEEGKYPAEWGLYKILLVETGIHQKLDGSEVFAFSKSTDKALEQLWCDTDGFLKEHDRCTPRQIYQFWSCAPYGLKKGLHSVLLLSYVLSRKANVASYLQGMYLPEVSELFVDYLIKESNEVEIKYIENSDSRQDYVVLLQRVLGKSFPIFKYCQTNLLDISRKMVAFINGLNDWVMRTKKLNPKTMRLRDLLKNASDPNKLLFEDIIKLYSLKIDNITEESLNPLVVSFKELQQAYPNLIKEFRRIIFKALQFDPNTGDVQRLHQRAKTVNHATGDFRIDALASRLSTFNPESDSDIAGIASLAANKALQDWIDLDVERATIELGQLCDGFKKAELYVHLKGKPSSRRSFVLMSSFNGEDSQHDIDFSLPIDADGPIQEVKQKIMGEWEKQKKKHDVNVFRAALLELSLELSDDKIGK